MQPSDVMRINFERIATVNPRSQPDHLDGTARRVIHEVPLRSRVLEIGCGSGSLARELVARRGARVTAIDVSARMIDVARVRTNDRLGIEYRVADFMTLAPRGFDVAVAVDTLHYLPLALAAERMADTVVPHGLVVIADHFTASGMFEVPYSAMSWLLRQRGRDDAAPSLREIRRILRAAWPGVVVRRHLGWRYTAIWRKP